MRTILLFDIKTYTRRYLTYGMMLLLAGAGIFTGMQFNLSIGEGVLKQGPYTIGFMTGMLSLSVIFIATVLAGQLLFREWDSRFDSIVFTTPVSRKDFILGRFLAFFLLSFSAFALLMLGFAAGQYIRSDNETGSPLIIYYVYPLLLFGFVNTLFTCAVLQVIAFLTRRKLMVITGGLLLYILYMVVMLFSNAPFMAGSMPQSITAQQVSTLTDPFGLSAYFYAAKDFTVIQRNTELVLPAGYLLMNRLLFTSLSILLLFGSYRFFSFSGSKRGRTKKPVLTGTVLTARSVLVTFPKTEVVNGMAARMRALLSFSAKDLVYIFKSIAFVVITLLLLFAIGMEMYAAIEKGIRLPQLYARSGLMAATIIENFHFLGLLLIVYFANDLSWRSRASGFALIEDSTLYASTKLPAHWLSCIVLLLYFGVVLVLQGLIFQWVYGYMQLAWGAYAGVLVFNICPLILFAGVVLLLNHLIKHKYAALAASLLLALMISGPVAQKLIPHPLFRFFSTLPVAYSDFNGYSVYLSSFLYRLLFGASIVFICWILVTKIKRPVYKPAVAWLLLLLSCVTGWLGADHYLAGYRPLSQRQNIQQAVMYEKKYRQLQLALQPVITSVNTTIELYPDQQAYIIRGRYTLRNKTGQNIQQILLNFHPDLSIREARYIQGNLVIKITEPVTNLVLDHPLPAGDTAMLDFTLDYRWYAVNGHAPFNAIIEDGSFMRISRYYPRLGYQPDREISDENERTLYRLGTATGEKKLEAPRGDHDFIELDMTIGVPSEQTAIGTGELTGQWEEGKRRYFRYRPVAPVPFRFALSAARYAITTTQVGPIPVSIFYHPAHLQNVTALIDNIKTTLAYCETNFSHYPFQSLRFAEVSSYTKGFAATAYPGTVFMTENMIFQANIKADPAKDVINELAGHEIAHFWWGNQTIAPDDREGGMMLTESLAMYTEMMVYKKIHGAEKMKERLLVHQQIYDAEKGFTQPEPLYKVRSGNTALAYSKGALVMVQLSELIGEDKMNEALRSFLQHHRYPQPVPVATDLIREILQVSDAKYHNKIRELFEKP